MASTAYKVEATIVSVTSSSSSSSCVQNEGEAGSILTPERRQQLPLAPRSLVNYLHSLRLFARADACLGSVPPLLLLLLLLHIMRFRESMRTLDVPAQLE